MKQLVKGFIMVVLNLITTIALASPPWLITHNKTNYESNAYVGTKPSPEPTKAHHCGRVPWAVVRITCYGKVQNGICTAIIKMGTNTANPITLGAVSVNIESGDINPKILSTNGFTLTVNGPGETTITQD